MIFSARIFGIWSRDREFLSLSSSKSDLLGSQNNSKRHPTGSIEGLHRKEAGRRK